jgi:hypothetical protein
MIEIEQKWIEWFYFDPVMAAHVVMGARLDTFQKARLRFLWFTPETIDSSGVGTGKTIVDFVYLNLRCILIPNHLAAIYFPNFQVGKDAFWNKYFPAFEEQSPIFRAQFAQANKREEEKANQRNPGAWIRSYKNGSKLFMPAPDFKGDSKNQASRDFNTVVIDDYLRAEDQGDGIDKQLVDRARAPSFNKNHPIWCNHIKFLGHAESPTHKGYERVKAAKAMIRDGSSRHSLISFCYLDWSPELARKYREDNLIASQKRKLPPDAFRRQYLGIWTIDGTNYYPAVAILLARRRGIVPQCARRSPGENFILGQDVAEPGSRHADFCAWVVFRVVELTCEQSVLATLERMGRYYHVAAVFAHQLRNRDAGQIAALTHSLDLKFGGFSLVVLDPGGGGRWVLPELRKERQFIHGVERKVAPMTTREDPLQVVRRPIVSFFGRGGGDFDSVVEEQWRAGEEGFIERSHQIYLDSWLGRHHLWPEEGSKRPPQQLAAFSEEQRYAQYFLDVAAKQVEAIRLLRRPDGSKLTSRRGYGMFEAKGKKDLGYASLYGRMGVELWLKEQELVAFGEEGACFVV